MRGAEGATGRKSVPHLKPSSLLPRKPNRAEQKFLAYFTDLLDFHEDRMR